MAEVVYLDAHERMTPAEALACAERDDWDQVIICGYRNGSDDLAVISSHLPRRDALWIAEHLKQYVLNPS